MDKSTNPTNTEETVKVESNTVEVQSDSENGGELTPGGMKALQAEREGRAAEKARADKLAEEVQKLKDANLSEQDRTKKERDDALGKVSAAELKLQKYEAAEKVGLPLSWARRLSGNTPEELEADAKSIKDSIVTTTPKPDPDQGKANGKGKSTTSVAAAKEEYLASRRGSTSQQ